jgi:hypothetical protein
VVGSGDAPYLNSLISRCGLAADYHAIAHPSLPNYIAMTSGSTHGITDDESPSAHAVSGSSLFQQLGSSWRAVDESMPRNCAGSDAGSYAVRHNPPTYYAAVHRRCLAQDVAGPVTARARFTFVTPNMCHDMHDCSVQEGDRWLASVLGQIVSTSGYQKGGTAIFITWDEDDGSASNHVAMLILSPYTPRGVRSRQRFDHYSLLRTTEQMLALQCLRRACAARSMRAAFGL